MAEKKKLYFFNKTRDRFIADADVADNIITRLVGLLRTAELKRGEGLYIVPCSQIHMMGMKYAIDALFLDRVGIVVGVCQNIKPGAISPMFFKAYACLELPTGVIAETGTKEGDKIEYGTPPYPGFLNS